VPLHPRERDFYWINSEESPLASVAAGGLAMLLLPAQLPIGDADDSVAQQLQIPTLQPGGTCWRPARKEVPRPVKLHCSRPPADVVSMSM
jgi:hypothetical protein